MNNNPTETNKPNNSEEVDLAQLFRLFGNAFGKLANFISDIFKAIFSVIIFALRAIIVNFKIIVVSMVLAGILGYVLERQKPVIYTSSMLIRPYFESKFQFVTNMGYYNALLENKKYTTIAELFEISEEEASAIKDFEIETGPETENDKLLQYSMFLDNLDSTRVKPISYEQFVENRTIYSGELFQITVHATKNDIFPKLENGITNSFTNSYSLKRMQKRDSLLTIQQNNIVSQLKQVDSLQQIYIKVLENDSKSQGSEFSIGGESFSLGNDRANTKEYELLEKEIQLRNELKELQEKKVDEDVFFDVISNFQKIGKRQQTLSKRYVVLFPVAAFVLLAIIYLVTKMVVYVKKYDA
ncbi:hypothetical protein ACFSQP_06795 [Bizionia sediminis]|uniref:Uncharacterized protein n=1 Tax=Bizionia sediminis TaxID=1737064 RepID=A0ABW5KRT9_9FLAO